MWHQTRHLIRTWPVGRAHPAGLAAAAVIAACLAFAAAASAHIYWTESHSIGRANLDGSHVNDAFFPFGAAYAVAANDTHVLWAGVLEADTIGRVDLDGSNPKPDFIAGAHGVFQMAIDAQHIYWTNGYANTIGRANLDSTGVNQNVIAANAPSGIAVDAGHVYWSSGSSIGRANLDGTGVDQGFIAIPGGGLAGRIAADGSHVYWINMNTGAIGRANADGTNVTATFIAGPICCGIAVDNGHIYWTLGSTIGRANLDGSGIQRTFIQAADIISGIAANALDSSATTTAVTPSAAPSFYGDPSLTFTASVSSPPGTPVPQGTVQFQVDGVNDGAAVALDAQGHAVYDSTFFLDVGDTVTARYSGDALHNPSSADVDPQIQQANTATTLTSSANPLRAGDEVTLTAKVSNTSTALEPFGSVQFLLDGEPILGPLGLDDNGEAGIVGGSDLAPGDHLVQALYSDDTGPIPDFTSSQASLTQRVEGAPTTHNPPPVTTFTPTPLSTSTPAPSNRFSLIRTTVGRGGTITLLENAPEAGKFTASARTRSPFKVRSAMTADDLAASTARAAAARTTSRTLYGTGAATATRPGRARVVIQPNARAGRALANGKTLRLRVSVTFRPNRGGPPRTTVTPITVKEKRR
jgi:Bacterial Ig-like domain (group 3)